MKLALSLSSLLFFTLTVLLTFQYEAFSVEKTAEPVHFTYDQEIEITVHEGKLDVIQHFSGLPNNRLSILWPADSGQATCVADTDCDRLTPDLSTITDGEVQKLSVSYEIPLKEEGNVILRPSPFAKIQNGEIDQTVLHVTDRIKSGGTWLAGLPLIGQQRMSSVDYFLFAGDGEIGELYWQSEPLSMSYKNKSVSLYSQDMPSDNLKNLLDSISFSKHVDIIISNQKKPQTKRVLFIRQGKEEEITRDLAIATVQSFNDLKEEDSVLLSVLANLLTNQMEGNSQAIAMTNEMNQISEEQKNVFLNKVLEQEAVELNASLLDSLLSETLKGPTSFFERNMLSDQRFPLVMDESRSVQFEGTPLQLDVVKQNNRVYYSLPSLMEVLDYSMREGEHGLYLNNGMRSFRFPVNEPFYVLNERRYDAPTVPIIKMAGKYYIDEKWLILLFLVDVNKGADQISINRIDGY